MCKYCEFNELNDVIMVAVDLVEVKVGERTMHDHILDVTFMKNEEDGTVIMYVGYGMDDLDDVAKIRLPIAFCPFCGRAL